METSKLKTEQPPWTELPTDVTANILQRIGAIDILKNARRVCTTWWNVCKDSFLMWRVIEVKNSGKFVEMPIQILTMCLYAVDCSQGQLLDISIEYFCPEMLLSYISTRCSKLRRLRIASAYGLTKELAEAITKFPQLEELDILFVSSILNRYIWQPDRICTTLSWFIFNEFGDRFNLEENNNYVLAVARNKPILRCLRNFENEVMDKELRVILDGCPRLEAFGLRLCFNVDIEE